MKIFKPVIFAASALLFTVTSMAQELNTFEAGTPASASEMNANFSIIANAFDELEARVIALEDAASDMSVEGRRYALNEYLYFREEQDDLAGGEIVVENVGFTRIIIYFTDATNGNLFYSQTESDLIIGGVNPEVQFPGDSGPEDPALPTQGILTFTYSQTLGTNQITVTLNDGSGDQFEFFVSKDGTSITQFEQIEGYADGNTALNLHEFSFMTGFEIPPPPN
ncbi:MAG: hypothetical protein CMQ38_11185 [Gammaproteobacteria bacterium]|nr:hypothetical protein [Gammaproteobacteria bacterium]|tara:strand:+ start:157 stop:828 length:672 start_codon:yes stop_codon:yes gene_type:complete